MIAGFVLAGSVLGGLTLGWIPALAAIDANMIGAGIGGIVGVVANIRHLA